MENNTNESKIRLKQEDWQAEQDFIREKKAEIFPLMSKSDEEIEKEVREQNKDISEGMYSFDTGSGVIHTSKEGAILFDIALRKEVRDLLNK